MALDNKKEKKENTVGNSTKGKEKAGAGKSETFSKKGHGGLARSGHEKNVLGYVETAGEDEESRGVAGIKSHHVYGRRGFLFGSIAKEDGSRKGVLYPSTGGLHHWRGKRSEESQISSGEKGKGGLFAFEVLSGCRGD